MRGAVNIDDICRLVQMDRATVEEVVKKELNSDATKVDQAVSNWFDGSGPFKDAENNKGSWKTGSKQKGRKGDK